MLNHKWQLACVTLAAIKQTMSEPNCKQNMCLKHFDASNREAGRLCSKLSGNSKCSQIVLECKSECPLFLPPPVVVKTTTGRGSKELNNETFAALQWYLDFLLESVPHAATFMHEPAYCVLKYNMKF